MSDIQKPFLETHNGVFKIGEALVVIIENNYYRREIYYGKLVFIDSKLGVIVLYDKRGNGSHKKIRLSNIIDIYKWRELLTRKQLRADAELEVKDILKEIHKADHRIYNKRNYEKHKAKIILKNKIKYRDNIDNYRDKRKAYMKEYIQRPDVKQRRQENYLKNKANIREYYQKNKAKILEKMRLRYKNNKEKSL